MSSESFDIYYNSLHFLLNEVHCLKKQYFLVEKSGLMIKKMIMLANYLCFDKN
jgi:hypothetical protein